MFLFFYYSYFLASYILLLVLYLKARQVLALFSISQRKKKSESWSRCNWKINSCKPQQNMKSGAMILSQLSAQGSYGGYSYFRFFILFFIFCNWRGGKGGSLILFFASTLILFYSNANRTAAHNNKSSMKSNVLVQVLFEGNGYHIFCPNFHTYMISNSNESRKGISSHAFCVLALAFTSLIL